jgi:hypothetical protein
MGEGLMKAKVAGGGLIVLPILIKVMLRQRKVRWLCMSIACIAGGAVSMGLRHNRRARDSKRQSHLDGERQQHRMRFRPQEPTQHEPGWEGERREEPGHDMQPETRHGEVLTVHPVPRQVLLGVSTEPGTAGLGQQPNTATLSTTTPDIETIWQRIKDHEGETFRQIRGGAFSYACARSHIAPDRTKQNIAKAHFAEALAYVPLRNTVPVQHLRGPSYIYAILMDQRIRRHDW